MTGYCLFYRGLNNPSSLARSQFAVYAFGKTISIEYLKIIAVVMAFAIKWKLGFKGVAIYFFVGYQYEPLKYFYACNSGC